MKPTEPAEASGPKQLDVGGVNVTYDVTGSDALPAVILIHGLTSDRSSWAEITPALAEQWRVYAPDMRGHGHTDWPGEYSFEVMRDDLRGFMDALGLADAVIIGHSMGGVAAYLLAQSDPVRVRALILEETPPPRPQQRPIPDRPEQPLPYDWAARTAIITQVNSPDPSWWDDLATITVPTLVVGGGDQSPFPQDQIAEMARRIPNCRHVTIDVGHRVHVEAPIGFLEVVAGFLADEAL